MRDTQIKQLGSRGYSYHVNQFGAREGGRIGIRLMKMIGGVVGTAVEGASLQAGDDGQVEVDIMSIGMGTVGKMITNLATTVSEADYDYLCDVFTKTSAVSGGEYSEPMPLAAEGVFDLHFAGEYVELGQWLVFAIEVNFGRFFGEGGLIKKAQAVASARQVSAAKAGDKSASTSPKVSNLNGTFGG